MLKKLALLWCVFLLIPGGVTAKEKVINLKYTPREKVKVKPKKVPAVKIYIAELGDVRSKPKVVGENLEEKDKKIDILVPESGEPRQFLRGVLKKEFQEKGFTLTEGAGNAQAVLAGTIVKFWTVEKSRYKSEIHLKVTVKNKEGAALFSRTYVGNGENFGRSLSEENYQESFSNAAARLVDKLFSDAAFLKALADAPQAEKGQPPGSKGVFGPK